MISNLDKIRDLLEIISSDLGVTDPVSGPTIDQIYNCVKNQFFLKLKKLYSVIEKFAMSKIKFQDVLHDSTQ